MNCNLQEYKEFIDNEMLVILGQMDKATPIFDHLYLVRHRRPSPSRAERRASGGETKRAAVK